MPQGKASDLSCSESSSKFKDEGMQLSTAGLSSRLTPQKIEADEAHKSQSNSNSEFEAAGSNVAASSSAVNSAAASVVGRQ